MQTFLPGLVVYLIELYADVLEVFYMACFIVPGAEAVVTTVIAKVLNSNFAHGKHPVCLDKSA